MSEVEEIQRVIGNLQTDSIELSEPFETNLHVYKVQLTDAIKGIPRDWFFSVLVLTKEEIDGFKSNRPIRSMVFDQAGRQIRHFTNVKKTLIFVNPNTAIGEFKVPTKNETVFTVESVGLSNAKVKDVRNAPFFAEIMASFKKREIPVPFLTPYIPGNPAVGWRFSGRSREIRSLEAQSNVMLFGGRKLGKSSIVSEYKRLAESRGESVFYIPCQAVVGVKVLVDQLVAKLDPRAAMQLQRSELLGTDYKSKLFQLFKKQDERPVLIFDEIGNVFKTEPRLEDWNSLIGALRETSQQGLIRVIFTAFHELIDRQLRDHEGPFHNFGLTVRISTFSISEVAEFLVEPLKFWTGEKIDSRELAKFIVNNVSSHPYILTYLGEFMFNEIFQKQNQEKGLKALVMRFLEPDQLKKTMASVVFELYDTETTPLMRFVYLKACELAESRMDDSNRQFADVTITDDDVRAFLLKNSIMLSRLDTLMIIKKIELRGWVSLEDANERSFSITTRMLYDYLKKLRHPLSDYIEDDKNTLLEEMKNNGLIAIE